jgi:oxygen-independent coproporphyrinogen-3 oxidase
MELFAVAREKLLAAGYESIGMDHFAKPQDELARARKEGRLRRNFQGYAVIPGDDVLGFGISAIGDVRGAMFQNEKKLSRYNELVMADRLPVARGIVRSRDDEIRADVIHRLMCNFVIDRGAVEERWGIDFGDYFAPDLELLVPYREEGLVTVAGESIRATAAGEIFVRNLAMCFDRYMREKHAGESKPVFSRTV